MARVARRLATNSAATPRWWKAAAASSAVSPAPMITTLRPERSPSSRSATVAASEEIDIAPWPIVVSERTRPPVDSASRKRRSRVGPLVPAALASSCARRTWPRISASPTTIESRPEATRKRWRGTSSSLSVKRTSSRSSVETPPRWASTSTSPARAARASSASTVISVRLQVEIATSSWIEPAPAASSPSTCPAPSFGSARRSRSATGAVRCETPMVSSSLTTRPPRAPPPGPQPYSGSQPARHRAHPGAPGSHRPCGRGP